MFRRTVYEHDLRNRSFCVVPIKISVKNCSWNRRIGYTLEMLSSDRNEASRSTFHKFVFQWTGPTSKYSVLSANEEQTYIFKAYSESKDEGSQEHYATNVHEGGVGMKGLQMPNTSHLLTLVRPCLYLNYRNTVTI
ncbi:14197_t:CDS:2 [Dentiscutata erythropus]|uniref:14197_t:CDS:1 n=1 Tax=Dentiscutata erythropus TaxID=1348616 RepID=A0A9N9FHX5_9GLOM|nr:14197_t:CDS:2 [Dentiscutata erythropus]